jgi:hypothetical protein
MARLLVRVARVVPRRVVESKAAGESRYVTPTTVLAQVQLTALKEIRAQRFTLVNEHGDVLGVFGIDESSNATIKLFDDSGREIFRAGPPFARPVAQK